MALVLCGCAAVGGEADTIHSVITRAGKIKESERPLVSTPGSQYTVTIEGLVTNAGTGMTIPSGTILVVTVAGS